MRFDLKINAMELFIPHSFITLGLRFTFLAIIPPLSGVTILWHSSALN